MEKGAALLRASLIENDRADMTHVRVDRKAKHEQLHDGDKKDRKSTRLNSSHRCISYAVFCLKKKNKHIAHPLVQAHQLVWKRRGLECRRVLDLLAAPCDALALSLHQQRGQCRLPLDLALTLV